MVLTVLELWTCTASGPQQGIRDLERHGSHAALTCEEWKVSDSGPITDEVLTIRDGLPRYCGVAEAKKMQKITRTASPLHTCTTVVNRNWTK